MEQPNELLIDGDIIPGGRVGSYHLGLSWPEIQSFFPAAYHIDQRHGCFVLQLPNIWFFADDTARTVTQITVLNAFRGMIRGRIGIGSTLADVKRHLGGFILGPHVKTTRYPK